MNKTDYMKVGFWCGVILICLFSWYVHAQMLMNADVSALLMGTERMLQGGNYINDFFDPNPPMIMYFYIIPVKLSQLLHIQITRIFPFYIFAFITVAFAFCYRQMLQICAKKDYLQAYLFLWAMLAVFLLVPIKEYGQRDHLLVVMAFPYLLATVCRMQGKQVSASFASIIGVFAGLAIAFKPQFLELPAMIECLFMVQQKRWLAWFKPEILAMGLLIAAYVLFLLIGRQDYVFQMMPFLMSHYYDLSPIDQHELFFNVYMIFVYAAFPVYVLLHRLNQYSELGAVLVTALAAFTLSYFTQCFPFFYHMIPAVSLALLMLAQLYINIVMQKNLTVSDYRTIAASTLGLLILLVANYNLNYYFLNVDPVMLVGFAVIFTVILLLGLKDKRLSSVMCILLVSCFFSYITLANMTVRTQLHVMVVMTLLLASGFIAKYSKHLFHNAFAAVLAILFFGYPLWLIKCNYNTDIRYKNLTENKLIDFIQAQPPHQSIYVLSPSLLYTFPLAYYADVVVAQRFTEGLWMFMQKNSISVEDQGNKNIINMVAEDFQHNHPDLVFVEVSELKFNLLKYSLENGNFKKIWQHYHYFTSLEVAGTHSRLDVYKLDAEKKRV